MWRSDVRVAKKVNEYGFSMVDEVEASWENGILASKVKVSSTAGRFLAYQGIMQPFCFQQPGHTPNSVMLTQNVLLFAVPGLTSSTLNIRNAKFFEKSLVSITDSSGHAVKQLLDTELSIKILHSNQPALDNIIPAAWPHTLPCWPRLTIAISPILEFGTIAPTGIGESHRSLAPNYKINTNIQQYKPPSFVDLCKEIANFTNTSFTSRSNPLIPKNFDKAPVVMTLDAVPRVNLPQIFTKGDTQLINIYVVNDSPNSPFRFLLK
jgi:hypothetical protein